MSSTLISHINWVGRMFRISHFEVCIYCMWMLMFLRIRVSQMLHFIYFRYAPLCRTKSPVCKCLSRFPNFNCALAPISRCNPMVGGPVVRSVSNRFSKKVMPAWVWSVWVMKENPMALNIWSISLHENRKLCSALLAQGIGYRISSLPSLKIS